jgi:hypothetical protein
MGVESQMEMIGAIENMNLTLQIPDDSIAAEIARFAELGSARPGAVSLLPRF